MFAIRKISTVANINFGVLCIRNTPSNNAPTLKSISSIVKYCTQANKNSEYNGNDVEGQNYSFNDGFQLTDIYPRFYRNELSSTFIYELLMKSLHCSKEEAQKLFKSYPELRNIQPNAYLNIANYLYDRGIGKELLRNNLWIFFLSFTTIKQRLEIISKMEEIEDSVLLLKFNLPTLKNVYENWNQERLTFMKEKLGWKTSFLINYPHLLACEFNVFREKFNLLQEHGLQVDDMKENPQLFKLSATHIQNRLKDCSHFNIGPLKCWMLMCSKAKFEKLLSSWKNLGSELQNQYDTNAYLQLRLNCDEKYINFLSYRFPSLLKIPVQQIKLILDFLYSIGYNSSNVCLNLRILKEDIDLLKVRYAQFQSLNYRPPHVYCLMAENKGYDKFISNLVENRDSEQTSRTDLSK